MLVSLPHESLAKAAEIVSKSAERFAALVVEWDEVSLTVEEKLWKSHSETVPYNATEGPFRAITLQLDVDLGVSGYFAPAAERLADAGIPIVPQCAYLKDHVLVYAADAERTVGILEDLVKECAVSGLQFDELTK
jgi:hypothetical protein